jgi:hypothetical protein
MTQHNYTGLLYQKTNLKTYGGFSLVEVMISLVLMGFILIPLTMTMGKIKARVLTAGFAEKLDYESYTVIDRLMTSLAKTHTLFDTSFNQRLYTETYDTGNRLFENLTWAINPISGINHFQRSVDGGNTWNSPYLLSLATDYALTSGEILYCGIANNCTLFLDTNGNGNYGPGDAAGTLASGFSGTPLTSPINARKIVLKNWVFRRTGPQNQLTVSLPDVYIDLPEPAFSSTNRLLNSFSTVSGSFPATGFDISDMSYDNARRELYAVGLSQMVYRLTDEGIPIGPPVSVTGVPSPVFESITVNPEKNRAYVLNQTDAKIYTVIMVDGASTAEAFVHTNSTMTDPKAVAYNPGDGSIYVVGTHSGSGVIRQYNGDTLLNTWTLPTGLANPVGMMRNDLTTELYVWNQTVTSNQITLYKIKLGVAPAVTHTTSTYNLAAIGNTTTTGNYFGLAFDIGHNIFYLSDRSADVVYKLLPKDDISQSSL